MVEEKSEAFDIRVLKDKFRLSDAAIKNSGFSDENLSTIYNDYVSRIPELEELTREFLSKYMFTDSSIKIHSFAGRVKDPYHLIEKIVRKKTNNAKKYNTMAVDNYYKYITDLIGCRVLLVYKEDWLQVHDYLLDKFSYSDDRLIDQRNYAGSYDDLKDYEGIVERPKAYIRKGDYKDIYQKKDIVDIDEMGYYRSIHYIIKYKEYYLELQVRSLFDEAWGEVDHDVLYPYFKDDDMLVRFSQFINRLSGMGDELSEYFKNNVVHMSKTKSTSNPLLDTPKIYSHKVHEATERLNNTSNIATGEQIDSTPKEELMNILMHD